MKGHLFRKCVDIVMFFVMCFVAGTGLLIEYRLAPCSRGGDDGFSLWGLGRHDWGELHLWAAYALICSLIVHIILNFSFIRNVVMSKSLPLLAVTGLAGAAIVLCFLLVPVEIEKGGKKCGETVCPSFSCQDR